MEPNLFGYIWRHSRPDQIRVMAVVLLSLPFYYLSLNLPKDIVNGPIQGEGYENGATHPFLRLVWHMPAALHDLIGREVVLFGGFDLDRMSGLFALSGLFLALVCINGLFKFQVNTMKGRMGERLLRRMRYELVDRVLRFPIAHFKKVKQSEVASMVKDEVEPIGGFIGDAYALPLLLAGQALTAVIFIVLQSPWLGLVAVTIVLFQAFVIPKLRRPILQLGRMRQLQARELAGRVGEIVDGIADIHGHDTSNYERAELTRRLGRIFHIRFELYQRKFFIKFLNNFLAQVTPFIFYALGGYLAIHGQLSIGELVAVIAAYKDLPAPIKDLIDWDLHRQDAQIKYEQVIEQFHPPDVMAPELQVFPSEPPGQLTGQVVVVDVSVTDDWGARPLDGVSFDFDVREHVAFQGPPGSGKEAAALLLARALSPRSGQVTIGGIDLASAPQAITGRRIGYVGPDVFIFPQSLRDNILYGLKHQPVRVPVGYAMPAFERAEIVRSGNALFDVEADWVDYDSAGAKGPEDIDARIFSWLNVADFEVDIYQFGLRTRIDPDENPELADKALSARRELRERLLDPEYSGVVEPFDPAVYNRNATLAENLLFGTPVGSQFETKDLATNPELRAVLIQAGLDRVLLEAGLEIADTMVELFRDLPPDHPFFEQFSFIAASELPEAQALLKRARAASPLTSVNEKDKSKLFELALKYVDARHRLGLITEDVQARVLQARAFLRARIEESAPDAVDFFDPDRYSAAATFQDNILLGRVAYGVAGASERIAALIADVLSDLGLRDAVLRAGLAYDAGASGRRLSFAQRQKVGLLRALIKQPDLLIVNQGLAMLDASAQAEILTRLLVARQGRGVVWTMSRGDGTGSFDRVFLFEHGKIAEERVTSPKVAERAAE